MPAKAYDITIIGAGLVGSSLRIALEQLNFKFNLNLKIAVIEKKNRQYPAQSQNLVLDNRGIALSLSSIKFLSQLNQWDKLLQQAYKIQKIHVSEQNSFGCVFLESKKFNLDYFGYLISITNLIETLTALPTITAKAIALVPTELGWQITLDKGAQINTKLLIAADGENSFTREFLNIPTRVVDYQQKALVANINCSTVTAFQRFAQGGAYAILPFGPYSSKFILSAKNQIIDEYLITKDDTALIAQINYIMGGRIPAVTQLQDKTSYNLKLIQALDITQQRLILIGNAANTLPPVMAQGYNLGLRDVATLFNLFEAYFIESKTIDDNFYNTLAAKYAKLRAADHKVTVDISNYITSIFENNLGIIKILRKVGLAYISVARSLQQQIVEQGTGSNVATRI